MTDEQRMRAQVAKWRREDYAVDRHGLISEAMWDGYRSRDAEVQELREALSDMLSGWRYIRAYHGDLYGVGWNRAQNRAEAALAGEKGSSDD